MASAKRLPNEAMPPPDSEDRREFLAAQRRAQKEADAAAAERRRRAAARGAASSDAKFEQAAEDEEQAMKDKQSKDAYERVKPQPFRKGGMPDLTGDGKVTRADVLKGRGVFKRGGSTKKYAAGGSVSSASKRADGCATKGKTRGKMV